MQYTTIVLSTLWSGLFSFVGLLTLLPCHAALPDYTARPGAAMIVKADTSLAHRHYLEAVDFYIDAKLDSSYDHYKRAFAIYKKAQAWRRCVRCLTEMGHQARKLRKLELAEAHVRRGLEMGRLYLPANHVEIILGYRQLGSIYRGMDKTGKAKQYLEKGLDLFNTRQDVNEQILSELYHGLGCCYSKMKNYKSAGHYLEKALKLKKKSTKLQQYAYTGICFDLSKALIYNKSYDKSITVMKNAMEIINLHFPDSHLLYGFCFRNFGNLYFSKGHNEQALFFYDKAIEHLEFLPNWKNLLATIYFKKACVNQAEKNHHRALVHYHKAIRASWGKKKSAFPFLYCYNGIILHYYNKKQYLKALSYIQRAFNFADSIGIENHITLCHISQILGNIYIKLGEYDNATQQLYKTIDRLSSINNPEFSLAHVWIDLAEIKNIKKDTVTALQFYKKALWYQKLHYGLKHPAVSFIYNIIAEFHMEHQNYSAALKNVDSSFAANTGTHDFFNLVGPFLKHNYIDRVTFIETQTLLSKIINRRYVSQNFKSDLYLALEAVNKADSVLADLRHDFKTNHSRLDLADYITDLYSQAVRTNYLLYQTTGNIKYKLDAFKYAEKHKAAALRASMNDGRAKKIAGLPDSVLTAERNLKAELDFYQNEINNLKLQGPDCDTARVEQLETKYYGFYSEYMDLLRDMELDYPDYYNLKYKTQPLDVGRLQRSLDRRTALVEYFVGKDELYTFVLTRNNLNIHRQPADTVLINSLQRYNKTVQRKTLMQNTLKKQYLEASAQLYDLLLKPVEKHFRHKKHLIFIPDGQTHYVPFETLVPIPYPAGELFEQDYLIHQYIISYQYSAFLFLENRPKKRPKLTFTGFAPVFDFLPPPKKPPHHDGMYLDSLEIEVLNKNRFVENLGFGPLPESEKEVRDILERFNRNNIPAQAFFRWDATEERLKNLTSPGILHIATHGLFNEQEPEMSGLLFSSPEDSLEGGLEVLFSGELYNLDLPCDLVVLSSCGSGVGKIVRGEGVLSMTRGFYYAGASNMLFSLWKIADKHARLLMDRFYRHVLEGQSYAQALRNAKVELLRDRVAGLPNHWGAFVLVGK